MIQITEKRNCSGCFACANICPKQCITMESDNEGFWYPRVDQSSCIQCNLCEQVCPMLCLEKATSKPVAYAAYNKDLKVRMSSSSGGIFTLLAENVLNQDGAVFGACFDDKFQVVHRYAEEKEKLSQFRGSKYVQSKIGDTYKKAKDFLDIGRLVYFSGTPCQIAGLKSYLKKEYENLICQDVICHGVPSPKVWKKYIDFREEIAGASAHRITFRRKDHSWERYSMSFQFCNGVEYEQPLDKDRMMQIFLRNVCLRPSCYHCKFKIPHVQSDITLADYWGIKHIHPEMFDDKGTSLVLIHSTRGQNLFTDIKEKIIYKETNIEYALRRNFSAICPVDENPKRNAFFAELTRKPFHRVIRKYGSDNVFVWIEKNIRRVGSKIKQVVLSKKFSH